MVKGKKGLVLKFLLVLLLAIMIFGFGSCVISKFLRLSDQARGNFDDLHKEIMLIKESKDPAITPFVFIQDADTFVYFITDNTRRNIQEFYENKYQLTIPAECEQTNCICLCREIVEEDDLLKCNSEELVCKLLQGVNFAPGVEVVVHRTEDEGPRRQEVTIRKCGDNEPYCRGKKGDISVVFWWLDVDDKGFYNAIK